jgi:MOSC domain-containing protein YiiM
MSKNVGKVISLFISSSEKKVRLAKTFFSLNPQGIPEDKYYNKDSQRSVLIATIESYELLNTYDIRIPYGTLGENILIDYNPYHLPPGTQLKIGSTVLEISQNCTICSHLSSIDKRVPTLLEHDRGIFAKVIIKGEIKVEDTIVIV